MDEMEQLKHLLYSMAEKLTKSPVEKEARSWKIHSSSDGLQVTVLIDVKKFLKVFPEKEIDAVLTELEKDFFPDLGVSRNLNSIRLSRFLTEGGPWTSEMAPGVTFTYEIGKPIVANIDEKVIIQSRQHYKDLRMNSIPIEKTEQGWLVRFPENTYVIENEDDAKIILSLPQIEEEALSAIQYKPTLHNEIQNAIDALNRYHIIVPTNYLEMLIRHLTSLPKNKHDLQE